MSDGKFDPHRRLCPDGSCIGIIGEDGRCRVCGRTAAGGPAAAGFMPSQPEDDYGGDEDEAEASNDGGTPAGAGKAAAGGGGGGFDPNRRLCPDGSCLGVLGADGVCNVCGKKAD